MWLPSLRLEADGLDPLELSTTSGFVPQSLDLGFPVVREVVSNAPDADGTIDTTTYLGARNVTLALVLDETLSGIPLEAMEDWLRAYLSPSRRSVMVGQFRQGGGERRVVVRGSQWSSMVDANDFRPVVAQWVCPNGLIESAELHTVTARAGGYEEQTGRTYDLTYPRVYPTADPSSGGAVAENAGNVPVWPVVTMFGPASNGIVLRNDSTDQEMTFDSTLSIAAGDWIRIDFAAKTIVNSTGTSYYQTLDFPNSVWWQLAPGENRVFMIPDTTTAPPAAVQVQWRDGYL